MRGACFDAKLALTVALTSMVCRYDDVPELTHGISMRRGVRPDSVPPLTVEAANKDAAAKDNDDTDSDQSYRYCSPIKNSFFCIFHRIGSYLTSEGEQYTLEVSPTPQSLLQ